MKKRGLRRKRSCPKQTRRSRKHSLTRKKDRNLNRLQTKRNRLRSPRPKSQKHRLKRTIWKNDLLNARSQLAAYEAGVAPEMIADAVTLAMSEAKAAGEVTEEAVRKGEEGPMCSSGIPNGRAAGTDNF